MNKQQEMEMVVRELNGTIRTKRSEYEQKADDIRQKYATLIIMAEQRKKYAVENYARLKKETEDAEDLRKIRADEQIDMYRLSLEVKELSYKRNGELRELREAERLEIGVLQDKLKTTLDNVYEPRTKIGKLLTFLGRKL